MVRRCMSASLRGLGTKLHVRDGPDLRKRGGNDPDRPNGMPSAPTSITVCALNWVAMSPPSLAPIGTAPNTSTR